MKSISVCHFIDSLGSGIYACEYLEGIKFEHKYFFSFKEFLKRDNFLAANRKADIVYLDGVKSFDLLCKREEIRPCDIQISITPCKGLSGHCSTSRTGHAENVWIYKAVEWCIAQDNKCLILENASELFGSKGKKILDDIYEMTKDKYKMTVIKTNLLHHGVPHSRKRTILLLYQANSFFTCNGFYYDRPSIDDFLKDVKNYRKEIYFSRKKEWTDAIRYLNLVNIFKKKFKGTKKVLEFLVEDEEIGGILHPLRVIDEFVAKAYKNIQRGRGFIDNSPRIVREYVPSLTGRSAPRIFLPEKRRYLYLGEVMRLMTLPLDFKFVDGEDFRYVIRTCPPYILRDYIEILVSFLRNTDLRYTWFRNSGARYVMQDNTKRKEHERKIEVVL